MPLHMIKLCVGVAKVETLERRAASAQRPVIITTPAPAPSTPPVVTSTSPQP